jgi:hypothetical protein
MRMFAVLEFVEKTSPNTCMSTREDGGIVAEDLERRTRVARAAAELALVRVVHHYGRRPEFVLLGGLVPELLCSQSSFNHAGTIDIDVQVDLEIAGGSVNAARLEAALGNAEFEPDNERVWRWVMVQEGVRAEVKFELVADLSDQPADTVVSFDGCESLGAVNLRGTGFASRDVHLRTVSARDAGVERSVQINVTGLAGFLLAKAAAAHGRHKAKDWYDIAFVLLHNDEGGVEQATDRVIEIFANDLVGATITSLRDLAAYFGSSADAGSQAYAEQMMIDHPELDAGQLATDAQLAVTVFCDRLLSASQS